MSLDSIDRFGARIIFKLRPSAEVCVCYVCVRTAYSDARAFCACRFFNKLRVFNTGVQFDSPRLHNYLLLTSFAEGIPGFGRVDTLGRQGQVTYQVRLGRIREF